MFINEGYFAQHISMTYFQPLLLVVEGKCSVLDTAFFSLET